MKSHLETPSLGRPRHCLWICLTIVASSTIELAQPMSAVMREDSRWRTRGQRDPAGRGPSDARTDYPATARLGARDRGGFSRPGRGAANGRKPADFGRFFDVRGLE